MRLVGGADGVAEVGVVPGVDLAVALDQGRGGVHVEDLLGEGAVGTCFCLFVRSLKATGWVQGLVPVSAEVVRTTGRSKTLAREL